MRKARHLTITLVAAVCLFALTATSAYASTSETAACTGCHMIDAGYSVSETLASTTTAQAAYNLTVTGPTNASWAVFSGTNKLASGTGLTGTFAVNLGQQYDVFAVGTAGGMSTGAASRHFTAPDSTLPSTATPDSTAPAATTNAQATYYSAANLTISATDLAPGWGVAYIYYRIDDHFTHMYRATGLATDMTSIVVPASDTGTHTLRYWAQDRAGNVGAVQSVTFAVKARIATTLGAPIAPAYMYRTRSYTVYGYLKPQHTAGTSPVRIYKYRYVSGAWRSYGYTLAKAYNYSSFTKYATYVRLPYAGRWRLRAYAPSDTEHLATWSSSYDYVTVR